jgi:HEAT repeat protein
MSWHNPPLRSDRRRRAFQAAGAVLGAALLACALPARADPVEDLREVLAVGARTRPTQRMLDFRRTDVEQHIKALKTVNDLYRALLLTEWRDDPRELPALDAKDREMQTKLFELDRDMRGKVIDRLVGTLRSALAGDNVAGRQATATFIAEMGTKIRTTRKEDRRGLASTLAPDLVKLTRDESYAVRTEAARALGLINPVPKEAVSALKPLLERDRNSGRYFNTVAVRRSAAGALADLIRVVAALQLIGESQRGSDVIRAEDVIDTAAAVVPVAALGAADVDARVRRQSVEALRSAAASLEKLIPEPADFFEHRLGRREPFPRYLFPPRDFALTKTEQKEIALARKAVEEQRSEYAPLVEALGKLGPVVAARLEDRDGEVRLLARKTLEFMASSRQRLNNLGRSVPPLDVPAGADDRPALDGVVAVQAEEAAGSDPLARGLEPGLHIIDRGIHDPDRSVRLAAVEFLEMLDEGARPAIPALAQALGDSDSFVRWAAARTMFRLGPDEREVIPPALARRFREVVVPALAHNVQDPDVDARLAVLRALRKYAPYAAGAVPALIQATQVGDAESRVEAIRALEPAVPRNAAGPAVKALVAGLKSPDVSVRQAAAPALGNLGAAATAAIPALRAALEDPDEDVRRLASEALLTIEQAGRR